MGRRREKGKGLAGHCFISAQRPAPSAPKMEVASPAQSNRLAAVPATAGKVPRYVPRQVQGQVRWASAARGARLQLPGPQDEAESRLADQGRARPGTGASARWDPSSIVGPGPTDLPTSLVPKYQPGIMSASQNNSAGRQAYSYVLCKSEELLHTPLSLLVGHLEVLRGQLSPKCSLRQQQSSGRPASLRVLSPDNYLGTSCRLRLAPGNVSLRRRTAPCRAPTPKNTTATKAVNSWSKQSRWQRAVPRCATNRSPH